MATVQVTNAGLNMIRDAMLGRLTSPQVYYLGVGTGLTTLSAGLTSGNAYTSLSVAALPLAVSSGQSLTLTNGTNSQVVTASANASVGATTIAVTSFNANYSYPATSTAIVNTPAATDTLLQNEQFRKYYATVLNGSAQGEGIMRCYLAPQDALIQIAEFGWFATSTATSTFNTGVLVARAVYSLSTGVKTNLQSIQVDFDFTI
jgi:hypothetical protein